MVNEIENLKDFRNLLNDIKDEDLRLFGIGLNSESDGDITIIAKEGEKDCIKLFNKYKKQLDIIERWINNFKYFQNKYEAQELKDEDFEENDGMITSKEIKNKK